MTPPMAINSMIPRSCVNQYDHPVDDSQEAYFLIHRVSSDSSLVKPGVDAYKCLIMNFHVAWVGWMPSKSMAFERSLHSL